MPVKRKRQPNKLKPARPRIPAYVTRGKTVSGLIRELSTFEDQGLEVRISVDGGKTHRCISLVGKVEGKALLINYESLYKIATKKSP